MTDTARAARLLAVAYNNIMACRTCCIGTTGGPCSSCVSAFAAELVEWTACTERLPPVSGYYLATHVTPSLRPHAVVSQLWFNPDGAASKWWGGRGYLDSPQQHNVPVPDVTYWMPIPEPAREEG